jgi:aspartate ammonia-lyase
MNANEVIANARLNCSAMLKANTSSAPNDHVNCSQSTNDAYPTAIKLGVWFTLRDTLSALRELKQPSTPRRRNSPTSQDGAHRKPGCVPMTLGQEFSAYAVMIGDGMRHLDHAGRSCWK